MTTLADKSLLSGGDNKPPMLEKHLYDSWKSIMELYMMNRPHGRIILASVEKGLLIWPTITVDGVTRPKEYTELTPAETIQADCDIKAINIILQGLPTEIYALVSQHRVAKDIWEKIRLLMQGMSLTKQEREYFGLTIPVFKNGDDPIDAINHVMSFLSAVVSSRYPTTNNQLRNSIPEVALMANLSHYGSDALAEVHNHDNVNNNMINQVVQVISSSEQSNVVNHSETEITSDSNIIPYSQYVIESQQAAVQNSNSSAQQDALILSVIEQLKTQVANCTKINLENKSVNDTLTAELERYKEQVKVLNEGQNVDFKKKDNVSDSCAQSVEIDRLKQTLSEHLKEKESLMQKVSLLKDDFKKEESRNIDREIALEKRIKQLDNIVFKRDQSVQTVHMLTKPQFFYDHTTKQALGFQNPFYLKKAQQLEPKLYVGDIIEKTNPIVIPDSEETLTLAKRSPRPTKVEVPKVSMVNTSLKKLKHHLAGFDVCLKLETELQTNFVEKKIYDKLFKSFTTLEKHCISLEVDTQLNQEIFQRDNSVSNQSAPSFDQLFELNELKAQSQEKDTVIMKLKERIKSLSGKIDENKIKKDLEEIETINIELDHRVTKLIAENEHLKQTYKQLYDSIKPARIRSKEQCADLINQVNLKSVEISDLNASLQEKVLVITALKDELRKLKGKALVDNDVTKHPSDPEMPLTNMEPITPKLLNKRTAHSAYIKHTQEEAAVLRDLVDHIKANYPLDQALESACKYTKLIQELLTKISKTCPSINNSGEQLVVVTPKNKDKKVRFTEPVTSSRNTITKTTTTSNLASNKPMLSSTGVKQSTSTSGSQSSRNTKKDKIWQIPSSIMKSKVEAHPRTVKSSLKNKNSVVELKGTANVQHSKLNANSKPLCVKCNGCMLFDNHDLCVLDFITNVNARVKSKSVKKSSKRKVWKPTGKVFTNIGYTWRPTGRTFTIVGNACPLTRITTTTEVPLRKPTALENETPKPVVTLVYSRKPRKSKTNVPDSKSKVIQIVLWYLDSGCSKHMTGDRSQLTNFVNKFLGTVKFGNDHVAKILGYGDYQIGNVTISRVYYVEGLGHNLFSVGQFCDSNLEVAFRQHTCFIRNLEGVDLLTGSQGNNLYTLSLGDMMASSPICLLSKASKTKHGLVRGLPKLKFEKDHLCSACAMGKSKKKPHKPKSEDTNQEKLYLLHMDLCGPMRVASVNGKKYILVIVDDCSRFIWVKFLRSKDEAPDFIIKFLKMIQVRLKVPV
ncbi:retrovirus-related pol polyprotein from transposon TNT 1-94 [Tanacetum coccineum]